MQHVNWQLDGIVTQLRATREQWRAQNGREKEKGCRELPSRHRIRDILDQLSGAIFPMRLGPSDLRKESEDFYVGHTLDRALNALHEEVLLELRYMSRLAGNGAGDGENGAGKGRDGRDIDHAAAATRIIQGFADSLPALRRRLDGDVMAAYYGDPAARSVDEVLLCYPGVHAVIYHRIAHYFYQAGAGLVARIIAELAHSDTGIDIHPGARIGEGFFIDHGTGVVIGETAIIGNRVRLYQAVTLGAKRFPADEKGHLEKGLPRHPIVEDDVVVYAGATILGRITVGQGSVIGGNVWLTSSVPANSNITQANIQSGPCP